MPQPDLAGGCASLIRSDAFSPRAKAGPACADSVKAPEADDNILTHCVPAYDIWQYAVVNYSQIGNPVNAQEIINTAAILLRCHTDGARWMVSIRG